MNTLMSNFVSKVQSKHWKNLQRKTQKLDPSDRENLLEFLEDHLVVGPSGGSSGANNNVTSSTHDRNDRSGKPEFSAAGTGVHEYEEVDDDDNDEYAEENYELLQRDLDKANVRLEELQSKHDFLQTRLDTYRLKIKAAEDFMANTASTASAPATTDDRNLLSPERAAAMVTKIQSYKQALQPVEDTYQIIASELLSHQSKIESMQDRQMELKLKTQECQVVLEELCYGSAITAETPFSEDDEIRVHIESKDQGETTTIDRASFQDKHGTKDNEDVENARTNREEDDDEEDEDEQQQDVELEMIETTKETMGLLSIPVGTHAETE